MSGGCRIINVIAGPLLAAVGALTGVAAQAQEPRGPSTIVVFGDATRDWLADVSSFADLLDSRDRPMIVAGDGHASIPADATLVWFGDLAHDDAETAGIPPALRSVANDLGRDVADRSGELAEGEIRIGANCYTRHIDRPDGLPGVVANFSGDDRQKFCRGLSIAHLLGRHGWWIRNDGSQCMWRDCDLISSRESGR